MTQEEFKDEVGRLRPKLLGVARRYVGDEDAEDVVQDVLLRLWQMLGQLRLPIDALASVLTRNMAVSLLRRQPRPQPDASMMADEGDAGDDERLARILSVIEGLPPLQQTILRLRHMEGMELRDIAALTGSSEVAVRKALSRARQAVRLQYMKRYDK